MPLGPRAVVLVVMLRSEARSPSYLLQAELSLGVLSALHLPSSDKDINDGLCPGDPTCFLEVLGLEVMGTEGGKQSYVFTTELHIHLRCVFFT